MRQIFIFYYLIVGIQFANATTILSMDIDEVVTDAEFIFEGEVVFSETRQDSGSGIIRTYVTFAINDVLKGDEIGDSVELTFMGGAFNGEVVQVSGLRIPEDGEQGIYFVESLNRNLVNPLIGWSQGHFIIVDEDGDRRISTIDEKAVTDVQSVAAIPLAIKKPGGTIEGDSDVAAGVATDSNPNGRSRALTVPQFKAQILGIIEH